MIALNFEKQMKKIVQHHSSELIIVIRWLYLHMYTFIGKFNTRLDHSIYTKISHKIYLRIVYIQSTGIIQSFSNSTGNVPSMHRYDAYICMYLCESNVVCHLILKKTHGVEIHF